MLDCLKRRADSLDRAYLAAEEIQCISERALEIPWKFDRACRAAFDAFDVYRRLYLYEDALAQSDSIAIAKEFFINRRKKAQLILKNGISKDDERDPWTAKAEENIIESECRFALDRISDLECEIAEMLS